MSDATPMRRRRNDDPKPTPDGRCYVCPRLRPAVAKAHGDPFCSTECAKTYFAPLARRLGLFPAPRVLVPAGSAEFTVSLRDLRWLVEQAVPQAAGKPSRAERPEEQEPDQREAS